MTDLEFSQTASNAIDRIQRDLYSNPAVIQRLIASLLVLEGQRPGTIAKLSYIGLQEAKGRTVVMPYSQQDPAEAMRLLVEWNRTFSLIDEKDLFKILHINANTVK